MMAKQLFDNFAYFSTLAFLFLHGRIVQPEVMFELVDVVVQRAIPLLNRVQGFFREWHELDHRVAGRLRADGELHARARGAEPARPLV